MKTNATSIACLILIAAQQAGSFAEPQASQPTAKSSSPLVDPAWLEQHINDPSVRIIDLSQSKARYDEGHIPRAAFVHWVEDITDPADHERYTIAPKQRIETLLGKLGVSKETTIVLYDDLDTRLATRMFWTLRYYGHNDVRILDGDKNAWERAKKPFVTEVPVFAKTTYRIGKVNAGCHTEMDFIKANLDSPRFVLIDGRPSEQYTGEQPGKVFHTDKEHARKGHIPGALNIVWKENFKEDGTFKSVEELRKLYEGHGATKDKTIVTYCNEGLHASPPWFVLTELLGYRDVRLYDNSMVEWANSPNVPIVTGTKP